MATAEYTTSRRFVGTTKELIAAMIADAKGPFKEKMKNPEFRKAWMHKCGYRTGRNGKAYVIPM